MTYGSTDSETQLSEMTSPGVRIPPPFVYAAALGISWLLQRIWLLPFLARGTALWLGFALVAVGLLFALISIATILRGHGTVNTNGGSDALVITGPYRFSRNPMYVALAIMYTGFAVALSLPWGLVALPLLLVCTQTLVIAREEAFLSATFGQEYVNYKARVRRWL